MDLTELTARHAAEMIERLGGGPVRVSVNDLGEATVEIVEPGDLPELQTQAERLLRHLKTRYLIVQN